MTLKINIDKINELIGEGFIKKERHPSADLFIYNYTQKTQFANHWCDETILCRGLVLDATNNVAALPFPKFWNYGERVNQTKIIEATEKVDGSLAVTFRNDGKFEITTRGSFVSEQAIWATEFLNKHYDLSDLPDNLTLLFEIIYPENRIVVDYGDLRALILIGARDRFSGRDLYYQELKVIADKYGFPQPKVYQFDSIEDVLEVAARLTTNEEGFVLRFQDGERLKCKGENYGLASRVLAGVSFKRVAEAMFNGTLHEIIEGIPDEFLVDIRRIEERINTRFEATKQRAASEFQGISAMPRKDFAVYVKQNFPNDTGYLFALLDGRDITAMIQRDILSKGE